MYLKTWAEKRQADSSPSRVRSPPIRLEAPACGRIIFALFLLEDFFALQQSYDQNHQGDDQKGMNQPTDVERKKPQSPKNDQDN